MLRKNIGQSQRNRESLSLSFAGAVFSPQTLSIGGIISSLGHKPIQLTKHHLSKIRKPYHLLQYPLHTLQLAGINLPNGSVQTIRQPSPSLWVEWLLPLHWVASSGEGGGRRFPSCLEARELPQPPEALQGQGGRSGSKPPLQASEERWLCSFLLGCLAQATDS